MVLISLLSASPRTWADTLEFANGQTLQTEKINPSETTKNFQYGPVRINYTNEDVTHLKLPEPDKYKVLPENLLVTDAHASVLSIDQTVFSAGYRAHEALHAAIRFKDVQPYLTKTSYQGLLDKLGDGSRELLILQLVKTSIPDRIDIIQTQVKGDLAWAVARGKIKGKDFWGTLALAREEGGWKLIQETWYGNETRPVIIKTLHEAGDFVDKVHEKDGTEFIKWVGNTGKPKTTLPLEYGKIRTPKDSFCFFFYLNPKQHKNFTGDDTSPVIAAKASPDMHLIWPTSGVRYNPNDRAHAKSDSMGVSVAADKDGYYPNKMNLRLPGSKPKEAYVGFLLSF